MRELRRELGLIDSTALVVGTVIGSGIFLVPNLVARQISSPWWILAVWVFSGVLTLIGGLAFAELGARLPATGGQYVYLREAYGPAVAFLCGWSSLLVVYTGAAAWMATSFALYLGHFIPLGPGGNKTAAVLLIAGITALNYGGMKLGKWTQNVLTFLKLGGLGTVVLAPFLAAPVEQLPAGAPPAAAFGLAMVACLLTYDGWVALGLVAGEVREPARNIPRALGVGIGIVMLAYVAANVAYLRAMTVAEIAASPRVAADAVQRVLGPAGGGVVALAVCFSVAGAFNGYAMAPPRMYFAMARDGLFFRSLGALHERFGTPHRAILLQGAWAAGLTLTGTYEALTTFVLMAAWIFYGLCVAAVITLRRKHPAEELPYRMWGYPWTALLFVLAALGFVLNTIREAPGPAAASLLLIAAGLPVYWFWRRRPGII